MASALEEAVAKTTIPIAPDFVNTKALRVIDLRSSIVHEDIGIRAKNIQNQPVSEYFVTIPKPVEERIASISAFLRQEPKSSLSIEQVGFDSERGHQLYKVTLPEPVQPNEDIRIGIKVAYTHVVAPLPKKMPQVAKQHLTYVNNMYLYSPYATEETKTTLHLPTNNVVSFTEAQDLVTRAENKIIYGPFQSITPYAYQPLQCHYEYSKPILTVTDLVRDVYVSHWARNMAVEESYNLRHDGARIDGEFSRIKYQQSAVVHAQTNVLKRLTFNLPPFARDVYYRDEIGNVSTSHLRHEPRTTVLDIAPRYPLFGGWNYTWNHGYNVDASQFVHYSKKEGRYILNMKFVENAKEMAIDRVTLNIVLPEGARNVQVYAPFHLDVIEHGKHFTNFDSTGRYKLVLQKYNVVREHEQFIQVLFFCFHWV
ncbi:Ribophorin I [Radiomyces spectabilis]|uniref:Ribophorin I n=1 Tax=Radiomyces spectabilis TaxID=64574 RepID=UPI00222006F2|nr:Ribophorin I [Radiomyces spectabilis]KAI8381186.1 Ribophorin I [Radiomyces spectabilis]